MTSYDAIDSIIIGALDHAVKRDLEEGGDGYRSCAEISERVGLRPFFTRRRLERLYAANKIQAVSDGPRVYFRALTPPPQA